jgi:glycosyltransferase involved in cell wall biosynthesis
MTAALREQPALDVEIAATDADGPDARITANDLPVHAGVVHLFPRQRGETLKYSPALSAWLDVHAADYDVIHVHSLWNYPVAAACRAARKSGVPYVLRPCGMLSDYTWQKSAWKKRAWWWLHERQNVRAAAGFHVTSDAERNEVRRLGVPTPVEVIPLGIAEEAWQTPADPHWLRAQCPQAGERPIVLFLSRLHPKKGIVDLLLPAFARLNGDAFLAIVGGEDDHAPGYRRQIDAEVYRLGLRDRVSLLGPVPPSRRWTAFDGCDLFVLPSRSENFGVVVAEAMARGKPVVLTSGVQIADEVAASSGGEIVAPSIEALSAAFDSWLTDPARRAVAGAAGQAYVRRNLAWSRAAERIDGLYRGILSTGRTTLEAKRPAETMTT